MALDPRQWQSRLDMLKADRVQKAEFDWHRSAGLYFPKYHQEAARSKRRIHVNLGYSTTKILLRSSYSGDPYIYVKPGRAIGGWIESAELLEVLLNDLWRSKERKKAIRTCVLNAILFKKAYAMSHYGMHWLRKELGPRMTAISPWHMWHDGVSVDESLYVFRLIVMPWAHAKKTFKVDLPLAREDEIYPWRKGYSAIFPQPGITADAGVEKEYGRVVVYEVHDQLNEQISVIADGQEKYLVPPRPDEYQKLFRGSKFTELEFNEFPLEQYGIGDLEPVREQFEAITELRDKMVAHVRRFNRKYAAQRQNLDPDAKAGLREGEDGIVVEMEDIDQLKPIEDARLSGDVYLLHDRLLMDQRETLGIDEYMRASAVPGVKTAYETSQVIAGRTLRLGEKAELVGDFIEEIGIRDIAMMKEYYDQPKVVQMTKDPAQGPVWMEVTRDQLQGEHQVSLHAGSAMPRDEQTEWQRGMALYQTFAGDPMVPHGQLLDVVMSLMRVPRKGALVGPAMGQPMAEGMGPGVNPFSQAQGQGQPTQPTDMLRRLWGGGR